ncbi:SMP-30/gluconolactonase/LRE family protein [Elusimicrobiota bacterium]
MKGRAWMGAMLGVLLLVGCKGTAVKTEEGWTVSEGISAPESVYYDNDGDRLFVSNVAGGGTDKDGKGWISILSTDGKMVSSKWVSGLNAPKGMRAHEGILWVSDIDEVVGITMKTGKIFARMGFEDAKFLNDVAVSPEGEVFVSDTIGNTIYSITRSGSVLKSAVFMSGGELESPNGLYVAIGRLYVASWGLTKDWSTKTPGGLSYIDLKTKEIVQITKTPVGNLDGLELDAEGRFLVSDWVSGKIHRIDPEGSSVMLIAGEKGYADIGYVPSKKLLVVPSMQKDRIIAYHLR